jgi:hypothetical protein
MAAILDIWSTQEDHLMTFHIQQAAVVLGHMVVGPKSTNLPTENFTPKPIIQETNGCSVKQ